MTPASMAMTLPHGADRLDTMQVTLRVEVERDLPERKAATHQAEKVHLDPTSDLYHRAYQSWRVGELDDKGVVNIFGDEWLFLFQVNKEGLEGETLDSADIQKPVEHAEDVVTQLDSDLVGQGSMTEYAVEFGGMNYVQKSGRNRSSSLTQRRT